MSDMATMPVPELVAALREERKDGNFLLQLTLAVIAGRLEAEYTRAEALQEKIDDCEYQRCPCRA